MAQVSCLQHVHKSDSDPHQQTLTVDFDSLSIWPHPDSDLYSSDPEFSDPQPEHTTATIHSIPSPTVSRNGSDKVTPRSQTNPNFPNKAPINPIVSDGT